MIKLMNPSANITTSAKLTCILGKSYVRRTHDTVAVIFLHKKEMKYNIIIILLVTIVYTCSVTANCPTDPEGTYSEQGMYMQLAVKNTTMKTHSKNFQ